MTSIEILEKIIKRNEEIYRFGSSSIAITNDEWNVIYKELKAMEIIKEHIVIDCVGNVLIRSITKENEQKILKEWLENEK